MLKKVVMGFMLIGLIGVLIVGGLIRTSDRLDRDSQSEGERQGRQAGGTQSASSGYQGGRRASLQVADVSIPLGQENRGNSRGQSRGGGTAGTASDINGTAEAWSQINGSAQAVNEEALALVLSDGETLVIEGRAWRYAMESGFVAQEGDWITLLGFYEDGEWKTAAIENHTLGMSVIIRSDSGRPMWAGRSRQGT